MKYHTQEKGFVVLFTILISSIVLLMALGITSIATKEVTLSIQSRDAAKAFFAADAGMECALYADRQMGAFVQQGLDVFCNNEQVTITSSGPNNFYFYTSVGINNDSCVRVDIDKAYDPDGDGNIQTRVSALGYNTVFDDQIMLNCGEHLPNPRRVERGYRATY